ncbi:MAG TPA: efflux RND transporter periplasmic adaptor subunit [Xanthomonadaceae bacterium]|nr:efflux RND transporter periplasmic adaptor subunit [Xanthomonadaceae bacterium]
MIPDTSGQDVRRTPDKRPAARRRWGLMAAGGVLAALLVFGIVGWLSSSRSVDATRLRIAAVTRGTLVRDASANGRVIAAVSPTLYAPAAATVNLKVHAGDKVQKDQVLATLESPELSSTYASESATLAQLENEVARQRILAEKQRLLAQRDADEARLTMTAATRDRDRVAKACASQTLAKVDCLKADDAVDAANIRSRHAAADSVLERRNAQLELDTKINELERQRVVVAEAKRKVDGMQLHAPVSGVIGSIAVTDRAFVPANAALMTVVDLSRLEVELEVPETFAQDIGIGMSVDIEENSATLHGTVSAVSPEVVDHQVQARVRFSGGGPEGVRQNQRVTARILIENKPNVLLVERGQFVDQYGGRFAYVVHGGIAEKQPIKIGATSIDSVEILDGLKAGDQVVIAGSDTFADAPRVRINN